VQDVELGETREQIDQIAMTIERIIANVLILGRELRVKEIAVLRAQEEASTQHSPVQDGSKIGRNSPCPCRSGRKWKQCCGAPSRLN
jgi:uncharacterized protein YecA (UPF0149 family)